MAEKLFWEMLGRRGGGVTKVKRRGLGRDGHIANLPSHMCAMQWDISPWQRKAWMKQKNTQNPRKLWVSWGS